jgi:hypothetical protein
VEGPEKLFPPLIPMTQGNYEVFLAENENSQRTCQDAMACAMALFNLGFVYAYPYSPYYDSRQALAYFNTLVQTYPQTPWAFQGRWWKALIQHTLTIETMRESLQADVQLHEEVLRIHETAFRTREAALRSQESTIRFQETAIRAKETTIRSQDAEIRSQDAEIRDLQERLNRSRDIDTQIDKKERELLR